MLNEDRIRDLARLSLAFARIEYPAGTERLQDAVSETVGVLEEDIRVAAGNPIGFDEVYEAWHECGEDEFALVSRLRVLTAQI